LETGIVGQFRPMTGLDSSPRKNSIVYA